MLFTEKHGYLFLDGDKFFTYNREDMIDKLKKIMDQYHIVAKNRERIMTFKELLEDQEGHYFFTKDWGYYNSINFVGWLTEEGTCQSNYELTNLCSKIMDQLKTIKNLEEGKIKLNWVEYTHKFKGGSDYKVVKANLYHLEAVATWLMDEGVSNVLGGDQTVYCNGEEVPSSVVKQLLHYHIDRY